MLVDLIGHTRKEFGIRGRLVGIVAARRRSRFGRPSLAITDADLAWLPTTPDDFMTCDGFNCADDRPYCHCAGRGGKNQHHFWFTREGGRLVLAGIGRQAD